MTVYRTRKGITAYCAKCRKKFRTDKTEYAAVEFELQRFEKEHEHKTGEVTHA